jgi:hypothetical protein
MTLADRVQTLMAQGVNKQAIANQLGITRPKVQRMARKLAHAPVRNEALEALTGTTRTSHGEHTVERKVPRLIRTEAEALAAAEIDLDRWNPVGIETRFYPIPMGDGRVEQGTYIKVRCVPRSLVMNAERVVDAIAAGLAARVTPLPAFKRMVTAPRLLRQRIITDLHIGGYAWSKTTGSESWDIAKARRVAQAANAALDAQVPTDATETCIAVLGDICHYDTPKGTTTGGTQLDLDSRVDLMLQVASEYLVDTIATEAESRPTTVFMVEGNHDKILSKALRRLLLLMFAKHRNVTITECYTPRQYFRWGSVLQGFTHGDANAERVAAAMPTEAGNLGLWDGAKCRELHSGHLHHEAEKQRLYTGTTTLGGIVRRTHIALTPVDGYHSDNAWVGSTRGMSDWYYDARGAFVGNRLTVPFAEAA